MPAENADALVEGVQSSYTRLAQVAADLNKASDELTLSISPLDETLKRLNLGIECWYRYAGNSADDGGYWRRLIGYAKIGSKWGVSLRRIVGHNDYPESLSDDEWLFSEAPRELRIEAVDHVPEFVEHLISETQKMAGSVRKKAAKTEQFSRSLTPSQKSPFQEKLDTALKAER